jgi:hypothetical protein
MVEPQVFCHLLSATTKSWLCQFAHVQDVRIAKALLVDIHDFVEVIVHATVRVAAIDDGDPVTAASEATQLVIIACWYRRNHTLERVNYFNVFSLVTEHVGLFMD